MYPSEFLIEAVINIKTKTMIVKSFMNFFQKLFLQIKEFLKKILFNL